MVKTLCYSTTAGAVSCVCWSYAFGSTAIESIEGMGNSCCGARPKEAGWLSISFHCTWLSGVDNTFRTATASSISRTLSHGNKRLVCIKKSV